ncbi:MAG: PucR family transcriptional regulator, partial [Clostridia bacterium]
DHMSYDVLYANLNGDGEFMGRVILPSIVSENSYSVYPPLRVLRDAVFAAIRRQNAFSKGLRRSFHRLFRDILGGTAVDRSHGEYCLHSREWRPEDSYRCLVISLREIEIRTFSVSYNCQRLEEIFPDSFAFFYEDNIVSVLHFNGEPPDSARIAEKADDFLREGCFKAGLSNGYRDVYQTDEFFRQALAALDFGGGVDPENRCYPFRKYALPYVIRYGMGSAPPEFFCDEALMKLKELGGGEGVDYYTTLKVYLENNMNLLHSAEKLYIHRTTLFYRINRVKEKLCLDLNDEETRRSLLMSFYIMDVAEQSFRKE